MRSMLCLALTDAAAEDDADVLSRGGHFANGRASEPGERIGPARASLRAHAAGKRKIERRQRASFADGRRRAHLNDVQVLQSLAGAKPVRKLFPKCLRSRRVWSTLCSAARSRV